MQPVWFDDIPPTVTHLQSASMHICMDGWPTDRVSDNVNVSGSLFHQAACRLVNLSNASRCPSGAGFMSSDVNPDIDFVLNPTAVADMDSTIN